MEKIVEEVEKFCKGYELREKMYVDFLFSMKDKDIPIKAIKHLLESYKRQIEINDEHQKINGELRKRMTELEENLKNSISKDKIKNKIKELERDMVLSDTRNVLKELLED